MPAQLTNVLFKVGVTYVQPNVLEPSAWCQRDLCKKLVGNEVPLPSFKRKPHEPPLNTS
jgi:hypothetical protein